MGYKIKQMRESKNMSQEELSRRSGISRGTIVLLESGVEHNASMKTLVKLAEALESTVDQIFFTDGA